MSEEFDRQVENLLARGYPAAAGMSPDEMRESLAPLKERAGELPGPNGSERAAFALVIAEEFVARERAVAMLELDGKPGFTDMDGPELASFRPLADAVELPAGGAYLIADVAWGVEFLNVAPVDALPRIVGAGRSPLTIDEGIAIVTQWPDRLREHKFSLLGSRRGDRRVPALWIKQGGRPRLGWCFAGAPHTWLGSASCATRIGA